jgi:hypothetical protein
MRAPATPSVRLVVPPEHDGARIDLFLAAATSLSRRASRAMVAAGEVLRNGEVLRVQSRTLVAGDVIDVLRSPAELGVPAVPSLPLPAILFEDAWLVVVDKPAGVLSQPAEGSPRGELTIEQQLLLALAAATAGALPADGAPPGPTTSGAVLFARTSRRCPASRSVAGGQVDRRYLAVVAGDPLRRLEIERPIAETRPTAGGSGSMRRSARRTSSGSYPATPDAARWSSAACSPAAPTRSVSTSPRSATPWSETGCTEHRSTSPHRGRCSTRPASSCRTPATAVGSGSTARCPPTSRPFSRRSQAMERKCLICGGHEHEVVL